MRRIALLLVVAFIMCMFTFTVAFAKNDKSKDNGKPDVTDNTPQKGPKQSVLDKKAEKQAEREKALKGIKPLMDTIGTNRQQLSSLKRDYAGQHRTVASHLRELRNNASSLTNEQLDAIKNIVLQIDNCSKALSAANAQLVNEKQRYRQEREGGNYAAIQTAYQNIITVQQQRIALLQTLIDLNKKLAGI